MTAKIESVIQEDGQTEIFHECAGGSIPYRTSPLNGQVVVFKPEKCPGYVMQSIHYFPGFVEKIQLDICFCPFCGTKL